MPTEVQERIHDFLLPHRRILTRTITNSIILNDSDRFAAQQRSHMIDAKGTVLILKNTAAHTFLGQLPQHMANSPPRFTTLGPVIRALMAHLRTTDTSAFATYRAHYRNLAALLLQGTTTEVGSTCPELNSIINIIRTIATEHHAVLECLITSLGTLSRTYAHHCRLQQDRAAARLRESHQYGTLSRATSRISAEFYAQQRATSHSQVQPAFDRVTMHMHQHPLYRAPVTLVRRHPHALQQ